MDRFRRRANQRVMSNLPQAVIFDGDGVLFDSEWLTQETFLIMLKRRGHSLDHDQLDEYIGPGPEIILEMIGKRMGIEMTLEDFIEERDQTYEELCLEKKAPEALPGVFDIIRFLREMHIPFALATGGTARKVQLNLAQSGLKDHFDIVVSASEVKKNKPEPDIYLEACRRLGVSAENCLVLEDSFAGIQSAKRAGARVLGIRGSHSDDFLSEHVDEIYDNPGAVLRQLLMIESGSTTP